MTDGVRLDGLEVAPRLRHLCEIHCLPGERSQSCCGRLLLVYLTRLQEGIPVHVLLIRRYL